jgi:hypothetical protein
MNYNKILLGLIITLTFSCQDEVPTKKINSPEKIIKTSIKNEEHIVPILNQIGYFQFDKQTYSNARTTSDSYQIDSENFLKVLQSDNKRYTYTFQVKSDSITSTFDNLLLQKISGGYLGY